MSSNGSVQIRDYSDRELLAIMLDLGGEVSTPDLAARIYGWGAIESEDKNKVAHGRRCVTSRLIWMRRYGLVESRVEGKPIKLRTWKVSNPGKSMLQAALPPAIERGITSASDTLGLTLANRIGERLVGAGQITGTAMRRELQFQIARRKR